MGTSLPARPKLSEELMRLRARIQPTDTHGVLSLGSVELDDVLPDGGFLRGAVTELVSASSRGQVTSLALRACAAVHNAPYALQVDIPWCAWVDPSSSLYAPGVATHGVCLERLLVVRPELSDVARVVLRMADSFTFSVLVVDTVGPLGQKLSVPLTRWSRIVRRLSLAAQRSGTCVLLLTERHASGRARLPVAARLDLSREDERFVRLRVQRDRRGRVFSPQRIRISA